MTKQFLHLNNCSSKQLIVQYLAGIYMFKVNNKNTRKMCEISLKSTIKTPEWCQSHFYTPWKRQKTKDFLTFSGCIGMWLASFWCLYCYFWTYFTPSSSVSIVNFEQINAGWVVYLKHKKKRCKLLKIKN